MTNYHTLYAPKLKNKSNHLCSPPPEGWLHNDRKGIIAECDECGVKWVRDCYYMYVKDTGNVPVYYWRKLKWYHLVDHWRLWGI